MVSLRPWPVNERRVRLAGPITGSGVDEQPSLGASESILELFWNIGKESFFSTGFAKLVESDPGAAGARRTVPGQCRCYHQGGDDPQ